VTQLTPLVATRFQVSQKNDWYHKNKQSHKLRCILMRQKTPLTYYR